MKKWLVILGGILLGAGYVVYTDPQYSGYFRRQTDKIMPTAINKMTAYRWKDKKGQWQLSDRPPPKGIPFEEVEYHKDANVIPTERLTGKKQ